MDEIYCYVPARVDSKRLPKKNLKTLGGKPMFLHIVESLYESCLQQNFWVNSGDNEILNYCEINDVKYYIRSDGLKSDNTTTEDILIDFILGSSIDDISECDIIIANPTNPLIKPEFINKFVKKFKFSSCDLVASANQVSHHLVENGKLINSSMQENVGTQYLNEIYELNWALVGIKNHRIIEVMEGNSFILDPKIDLIKTPFPQYLDVDTQEDFELVEYFFD